MQFTLFSLLLFLSFNLQSNTYRPFSDNECLDFSYQTKVNSAGVAFGLLKDSLELKKNLCVIELKLTKYQFLKNSWKIDVCRGPVHIKTGKGYADVLKKVPCEVEANNKKEIPAYCQHQQEVEKAFRDYALIHASGEKEDLSTDHGKFYCSFRLIEKYLNEEIIFNRHKKYEGILMPANIELKEMARIIEKKEDSNSENDQENVKPKPTKEVDKKPEPEDPIVREI